jgi:hypothetical protein
MKGKYAFLLHTFGEYGGVGIAGSVTADGNGKITGGEEDIVSDEGGSYVPPTISTTASLYAVGADHRGCLLLALPDVVCTSCFSNGTTVFLRFALGSFNSSGIATAGRLIEFDDTTGRGTRAAGSLRLQDPTSFSAAQFKGNYAFGTVGRAPQNTGSAVIGSLVIGGTFTSDGVSAITTANIDLNLGGAIYSNVPSVGNFVCCDASGRGTGGFTDLIPFSAGFVIYQINSSEAFFMTSNDQWGSKGEAIRIPTGTTFSQSSLNGAAVLREVSQSAAGPVVNLATTVANGNGTLNTNNNVNSAGIFTKSDTLLTYQVASNGRVTLAGASTPPVLYLYGPNAGFLLGTDADVTFGILEPQTGEPFSDSSLSGAYTLGTEYPTASTAAVESTLESGVVTANGRGNAAGTSDKSSPTGLAQNQSLNYAYSFAPDGSGNVGSGTTAILISGRKLAFISNTDPNPSITVVEK